MDNIFIGLFYLFTIYLVYQNSKKTNRHIGWTIGSVVIPFIVPIIYLITKSKKQQVTSKETDLLDESKVIFTNVAGIMYANKDGTSRQEALKKCNEGDELELVREPKNKYDPNAVAVFICDKQIGYLFKEEAAEIAPLLDAGHMHDTTILEINKNDNGEVRRCHIEIFIN